MIEAARKAGIVIPHFCYHPALGSAGACRLCAMKFLEGPVKGIQMSCMIPAQDGMVVSTTDSEAVQMRSLVIEWVMLNHPHDCPVCDEGGECQLQDYTVAGGHAIRRYKGKKRTHNNQYLGENIRHEMNRCIHCYRCVRFYQDFAGGDDFGVMGRANLIYFGRKDSGVLESPFSGNLVDICPTGVFTDKPARFRARYWDYDMAPSVCPHCSLGCNTVPMARYRELLKTTARFNDKVNGWFICDKGRFGNDRVNSPERPRYPLIDGERVGWDEALEALVRRVGEVTRQYGTESIALVGSPRMSLEGNLLLGQLAACVKAGLLSYFIGAAEGEASMAASLLVGEKSRSMAEVREADCIALFNCDLLEEGPMMALAVRQAWRNGAKIFLVGVSSPELKKLPFEFSAVDLIDEVPFAGCKSPVIICGTASADISAVRKAAGAPAGVTFLFNAPNSFAAAMLAVESQSPAVSEALAGGKIKAVIAFEADIPADLPVGVELLAVADWMPTDVGRKAGIFLPVTSHLEMDGTFINNEGRAQRFKKVMNPGLPIKGLDPLLHPPRVHGKTPQGGDVRPSWQVIASLIERFGGERVAEPLDGKWAALRNLDPEGEGTRIS